MIRRLVFATCATEPHLASDDALALPTLARHGFEVLPRPWDRHDAQALLATGASAVVLRSCWNYHRAPDAFAAWLSSLEQVGLTVLNPAPLARWNLDKRYLRELAQAGVPVPMTVWIEPGNPRSLASLLAEHGLGNVVLKPWVSMNGWDTWRSSPVQAAGDEARWAALVATRGMMIQQYLPEIETQGELSFVFFEGQFSHALRKVPAAGEFRVQEEYGGQRRPHTVTNAQIAAAERALEAAPFPTVYGRVDMVEVDGEAHLIELEVIDPTLFFMLDPDAPERFVRALQHHMP